MCVSSNRTLTAKFVESLKLKVTILSSSGGTTSPSNTIEVANGEYVDFTAIPNSGFKFSEWIIISGNVEYQDSRDLYSEHTQLFIYSDCTIKANFISSLTDNPISVSSAKYIPAINDLQRGGIEIIISSKYPLKKNVKVDIDGSGMYRYKHQVGNEENIMTDSWYEILENEVLTSGKSSWKFTLLPTWPAGAGFMIFNSSISLHLQGNDFDDIYKYIEGNATCTVE